jgi:hypothetical protein
MRITANRLLRQHRLTQILVIVDDDRRAGDGKLASRPHGLSRVKRR